MTNVLTLLGRMDVKSSAKPKTDHIPVNIAVYVTPVPMPF